MMLSKFAVAVGLLLLLSAASLSACGSQLPPLGQPGQATLVFIYTDN
jgi:hypothetical protein